MSLQRLLNHLAVEVFARLLERSCRDNFRASGKFEIAGCDPLAVSHNNRSLYAVLQFANIPGPRVTFHRTHCIRGEPQRALVTLGSELLQKLLCQKIDIFSSIP